MIQPAWALRSPAYFNPMPCPDLSVRPPPLPAPAETTRFDTAALRADPVRPARILVRLPAARLSRPADFKDPVFSPASETLDCLHGEILVVDGGWMAS
jgi:NAD(P)-dependent dehydrogenase (short-subunit alcohol dehydrogenase family)